ncbi:hypothetical protein STEG23_020114, partial [Scotinomys teguina]
MQHITFYNNNNNNNSNSTHYVLIVSGGPFVSGAWGEAGLRPVEYNGNKSLDVSILAFLDDSEYQRKGPLEMWVARFCEVHRKKVIKVLLRFWLVKGGRLDMSNRVSLLSNGRCGVTKLSTLHNNTHISDPKPDSGPQKRPPYVAG